MNVIMIHLPLWLCCGLFVHCAGASQQYCQSIPGANIQFCVAIDAWYNSTSAQRDLLVTFGHQLYVQGSWAAIGFGERMNGALMLVEYMGRENTPTISRRHGKGHLEPLFSDEVPSIEMSYATLNASWWFECSFILFACDKWLASKENSWLQPLIWAANPSNGVEVTERQTSIKMHQHYGNFEMKLLASQHRERPKLPTINFAAPPTEDSETNQNQTQNEREHWSIHLHGALMIFSLMVLFPSGALAFRVKAKRSLCVHLFCQFTGTISSLIGLLLAAYEIWARKMVMLQAHFISGFLILALLVVQLGLGHAHHQAHIRNKQSVYVTRAHIAFGRVIIVFGSLNAIVAIRLFTTSDLVLVAMMCLGLVNIVIVLSLVYVSRHKEQVLEDKEDEVPLIDTFPAA